ncbi:MAG TPA: imidazole glycerol phosphate synthase subunit HisH, partial [Allosphingosinicella sp.]
MKLAIVDVGCGNIGSVGIALERFGIAPVVTGEAEEIAAADRVVLPGVGAAGYAMEQIGARALAPVLRALRQPALGICLGMQLLFERSD